MKEQDGLRGSPVGLVKQEVHIRSVGDLVAHWFVFDLLSTMLHFGEIRLRIMNTNDIDVTDVQYTQEAPCLILERIMT